MCIGIELGVATRDLRRLFPSLPAQMWPERQRGDLQAGDRFALLRHAGDASEPALLANWGLVGAFLDAPPSRPVLMLPLVGLDKRPFYSRLLASQRCALPVRAFILAGQGRQADRRVSRADEKGMLLAGVFDHHPRAGWSFALIGQAAPRRAERALWPLALTDETASAWLGDWAAYLAEHEDVLPELDQESNWHEEYLAVPEPSPQLVLDFAWT